MYCYIQKAAQEYVVFYSPTKVGEYYYPDITLEQYKECIVIYNNIFPVIAGHFYIKGNPSVPRRA